jgi:hypothetical protein
VAKCGQSTNSSKGRSVQRTDRSDVAAAVDAARLESPAASDVDAVELSDGSLRRVDRHDGRSSEEIGVSGIIGKLARWACCLGVAAMLSPLGACSQDLPLPEGIDPQATPRIVVKKELIEVNGHALGLRVNALGLCRPWVQALGPTSKPGWTQGWDDRGLVLKVGERNALPYSDSFNVFLHRGRYFF